MRRNDRRSNRDSGHSDLNRFSSFNTGGNRGGGRFQQHDREMHKAVCADCGNECEVPFKPSTGPDARPVYCRECFAKHKPPRRF